MACWRRLSAAVSSFGESRERRSRLARLRGEQCQSHVRTNEGPADAALDGILCKSRPEIQPHSSAAFQTSLSICVSLSERKQVADLQHAGGGDDVVQDVVVTEAYATVVPRVPAGHKDDNLYQMPVLETGCWDIGSGKAGNMLSKCATGCCGQQAWWLNHSHVSAHLRKVTAAMENRNSWTPRLAV